MRQRISRCWTWVSILIQNRKNRDIVMRGPYSRDTIIVFIKTSH